MTNDTNPKQPGIRRRINDAILNQYARTQSLAGNTPQLVPKPDTPQNMRVRSVRWAVNCMFNGSAATAITLVITWRLQIGSNNPTPDLAQELTIIGSALGAWVAAEAIRILLPNECDIGEKASFGHSWTPDPERPNAVPHPTVARRALKQAYGITAATAVAATTVISLSMPYAWPALAVGIAAAAGELLLGRRNEQNEWQSLSDRFSNTRHCLKVPQRPVVTETAPTKGPGGGKRARRRQRSKQRRTTVSP